MNDAHVVRDAALWREHAPMWTASLNRRATVEQWMFDAANGKRALPTAEELRAWALKLGTPEEAQLLAAAGHAGPVSACGAHRAGAAAPAAPAGAEGAVSACGAHRSLVATGAHGRSEMRLAGRALGWVRQHQTKVMPPWIAEGHDLVVDLAVAVIGLVKEVQLHQASGADV